MRRSKLFDLVSDMNDARLDDLGIGAPQMQLLTLDRIDKFRGVCAKSFGEFLASRVGFRRDFQHGRSNLEPLSLGKILSPEV